MSAGFSKNPIAVAVAAALGASAMAMVATTAVAAPPTPGKYVAGDFHNHTTCSDGSTSLEKLVQKATDTTNGFALDWFIQAGHGNSGGTRNCTLTEDASLDTPLYPFVTGTGPTTTWTASIGNANVKGDGQTGAGSTNTGYMWRWQSIQEYEYPLLEYFASLKNVPLWQGIETNAPGHEHVSMGVITGQNDTVDPATLPTTALPITGQRYLPQGNANALAQWVYCFDVAVPDTSRGTSNNWDCSVPGSLNTADPSWNVAAHKLITPTPANPIVAVGSQAGTLGHAKTLEALKWMASFQSSASYYVPAHLERAGPFAPDGNQGYNIEHLRDFNNTAPQIAFGFESQPGHGASSNRGEYQILRNQFPGSAVANVDTVGGTTYGGTGVYAGQIGGVWDALLGEGRNWWFFASSDWHNRGIFPSADDRRTTQDFEPGEYQRNYTMVRNGSAKIAPQMVVDGLRTGNNFAASGQLIDRLAFVACASYPGLGFKSNATVENIATSAAFNQTDLGSVSGCATMGQKLKVRPGAEIVVSIVVRDPAGTNNSPYTFSNPSLAQVGINLPINAPVLDHVDVIQGLVTGYKTPGSADYSGEWPRNTAWLHADGTTAGLSAVPAGAKNTSAGVTRTFHSADWTAVTSSVDSTTFLKMTYRVPAVSASQYVRLRGTNMPAAVPYETDPDGNPLSDMYTNAATPTKLGIKCTVVHSAGNQFDGCPDHLSMVTNYTGPLGQPVNYTGPMVTFDVAAWSDLWFYSNPIYVEVGGSTVVAGVN
jgi:hypothetical protein